MVIRRILYTYDGNNRLVGRTAQAATVTSLTAGYDTFTWNLEIRPEMIAADGIPAETTFVWDPVSDRIITVVRAGDSKLPSDPNNNILKQIIHGDMGYDDPLEVTTVDTSAFVAPGQAQPVTKLYPIYDEAAGGTLQVVVNRNGEVVARSVNNDPFGGAEFDLAGAAIDHVEVQATKNAQGVLDSVVVTMRATEQLAAPSVASGARLAVVDVSGNLVRTSATPATPATNDPYTVKWTLSATDWAALSDPTAVNNHTPVSLSIAATSTLRASLWKVDLPILPAPDWATASKPVFSSSTLPVEVRESLNALSTTISALGAGDSKTTVSYDIPNLGLLGTSGGNADVETMLAATFQAQPFAEPFTRKFYVRERWYDPTTGTWLTPDPIGYVDSANLYAYAGGDPVNGRDPMGTNSVKDSKAGQCQPVLVVGKAPFKPYVEDCSGKKLPVSKSKTAASRSGPTMSAAAPVSHDLPRAGTKGCVEGLFIEAAGLPPVTREGEICGGAERIAITAATVAGVVKGGMSARDSSLLADDAQPSDIGDRGVRPAFDTRFGPYQPANVGEALTSLERAQKLGPNWSSTSLGDAIENVAGGPRAILTVTPTGKVVFTNPDTGNQVIYDRLGDYFRIQTAGGVYVGVNGTPINNVLIIGPKKTTQTGVPPPVRQAVTHFNNGD